MQFVAIFYVYNILFLGLKMQVIASYHDLQCWHLAITPPIISICLYCLILSQTVGGLDLFPAANISFVNLNILW